MPHQGQISREECAETSIKLRKKIPLIVMVSVINSVCWMTNEPPSDLQETLSAAFNSVHSPALSVSCYRAKTSRDECRVCVTSLSKHRLQQTRNLIQGIPEWHKYLLKTSRKENALLDFSR